jgi:hypothetical protein
MSHGAPEPGDLLDARYRLGPRLGTGGMGAVYRAEQLSIGRSVAIKLLHETGKDDGYRRFVEEARSASALQHPHIVEVYDFGRADDGTPYLVMELVDGRPLSTLLAERALGRRDALTVALQVWTALQAAHALGIVHADVKPANIMVGERVGVGVVAKLVDFGIARSATSDDRRIVGSPRYMAPEQFRGHAVDGRADIYALGVVLHEMVTGRPPFEAPTPAEYARAHLEQTPGDLPDDALGDLVRQCLSKHPWQRPTTPDALRRLLQDLDDAEPLPSSTAGEETHDFTAGDTAEASLDVGSRIVDADGVAWVIRQVQLRDARRLHVVAEHDGELRRFVRLHDPDAPGWELELWRDRWLTRLAAIDPTHLCALDRAWWDHDAWVLSGPPPRRPAPHGAGDDPHAVADPRPCVRPPRSRGRTARRRRGPRRPLPRVDPARRRPAAGRPLRGPAASTRVRHPDHRRPHGRVPRSRAARGRRPDRSGARCLRRGCGRRVAANGPRPPRGHADGSRPARSQALVPRCPWGRPPRAR